MPSLHFLTAAAGFISTALYLSAYSTGPANGGNDATSSGLGPTKCASCHAGGRFGTQTEVDLIGAEGSNLRKYVPGQTYRLRVSVATTVAPGGYGFQVLLIDSNRVQAGAFGEAPAGFRISTLNARSYFEHRRRSASSSTEIEWTAPAAGTGPVTLYAVGNAVNANGSTSGDQPHELIVQFAERTSVAVHEQTIGEAWGFYSPEPGVLVLSDRMHPHQSRLEEVRVASMGGQQLQRMSWPTGLSGALRIEQLPAGFVGVRIRNAAGVWSSQLTFVR